MASKLPKSEAFYAEMIGACAGLPVRGSLMYSIGMSGIKA
jgi:hypothetical protein